MIRSLERVNSSRKTGLKAAHVHPFGDVLFIKRFPRIFVMFVQELIINCIVAVKTILVF